MLASRHRDASADNQSWTLVPSKTSGYHRLVNVRTGWCADVKDGSTTDSAYVIQRPVNNGANQNWQLVAL
ncbi:RICIN domain-containing protein [Streptomyces sp. NPDC001537]